MVEAGREERQHAGLGFRDERAGKAGGSVDGQAADINANIEEFDAAAPFALSFRHPDEIAPRPHPGWMVMGCIEPAGTEHVDPALGLRAEAVETEVRRNLAGGLTKRAEHKAFIDGAAHSTRMGRLTHSV